jgi:DNA-binding response OmpR family regulator
MAESCRPSLILLDLILDDIHGTTVILALKSSHAIPYIPIIAVTGATLDEATTDILARFAIPTVAKPWNIGELLDTIETALLGLNAFQGTHPKEPPP